jgi:hypothetical protein
MIKMRLTLSHLNDVKKTMNRLFVVFFMDSERFMIFYLHSNT